MEGVPAEHAPRALRVGRPPRVLPVRVRRRQRLREHERRDHGGRADERGHRGHRRGGKVGDTKAPDELRAWCGENAKAVEDSGPRGLAKVIAHGATLNVGELVIRQWLGLPVELRELEDGSLSADPP